MKSCTSICVATVPPIATPVTVVTPVIVRCDEPTDTTLANTGSLFVFPPLFTSEYLTRLFSLIPVGNLGFVLLTVLIPAAPDVAEIVATPTTDIGD